MHLKGKKILLGITGSIAAYKSILLLRLLVKEGATVKVIMTPAAKDFVSPLVLSTFSNHPVGIELSTEHSWNNHVELGRWADLMLIAPLSCNTLAKMANGLCDNLLLAVYLSATCPIMLAPAMDEDMWKHAATQSNLERVKQVGNLLLPVEKGELASGLNGEGRMSEPETILAAVHAFFLSTIDFAGKKVLITAGPTYEPLDPVRFIGNHSSGKMGIEIAEAITARGANVTLVLGPSTIPVSSNIAHLIRVLTAEEMYTAALQAFADTDIAIMAAAVADYTPVQRATQKIKKSDAVFQLELQKTKDILAALGQIKRSDQWLVGFALETEYAKENAMAKLKTKQADMIVLNTLEDAGAGFGGNTNKINIFDKKGNEYPFSLKTKAAVANDIIDTLKQIMHA